MLLKTCTDVVEGVLGGTLGRSSSELLLSQLLRSFNFADFSKLLLVTLRYCQPQFCKMTVFEVGLVVVYT